jgi:hypothetical protein
MLTLTINSANVAVNALLTKSLTKSDFTHEVVKTVCAVLMSCLAVSTAPFDLPTASWPANATSASRSVLLLAGAESRQMKLIFP